CFSSWTRWAVSGTSASFIIETTVPILAACSLRWKSRPTRIRPLNAFLRIWATSSKWRTRMTRTIASLNRLQSVNIYAEVAMKRFLFVTIMTLVGAQFALAHIRIAPTESTVGAREKYTMRVPNEKQVTSSKIEGEFPAG